MGRQNKFGMPMLLPDPSPRSGWVKGLATPDYPLDKFRGQEILGAWF